MLLFSAGCCAAAPEPGPKLSATRPNVAIPTCRYCTRPPSSVRPDCSQHADCIAAENCRDVSIVVPAADEAFGQIEHSPMVIEALDGDRAIRVLVILIVRL